MMNQKVRVQLRSGSRARAITMGLTPRIGLGGILELRCQDFVFFDHLPPMFDIFYLIIVENIGRNLRFECVLSHFIRSRFIRRCFIRRHVIRRRFIRRRFLEELLIEDFVIGKQKTF